MDKGVGAVATVIVRHGTLKPGQVVVVGTEWGKIKGLRDARGKMQKKVLGLFVYFFFLIIFFLFGFIVCVRVCVYINVCVSSPQSITTITLMHFRSLVDVQWNS